MCVVFWETTQLVSMSNTEWLHLIFFTGRWLYTYFFNLILQLDKHLTKFPEWLESIIYMELRQLCLCRWNVITNTSKTPDHRGFYLSHQNKCMVFHLSLQFLTVATWGRYCIKPSWLQYFSKLCLGLEAIMERSHLLICRPANIK